MSSNPSSIVGQITDQLSGFLQNNISEIEISAVPIHTDATLSPLNHFKFPLDIFPQLINDFISHQSIQSEYLAGSILGALSTAIGNSVVLEAMAGYKVKGIVYIAIVAPPGASKSPAIKKAFEPLEYYDAKLYEGYQGQMEMHREATAATEKDKKQEKPQKPTFPQTLIKDSTIEMVVKILSCNPMGCCVLADELSGFLNRMNQYKAGDEVQKWLEMWSGSAILLQRITRDENKVQEPFCNIVGGIQPGVLETLSKADNEHNGFYHRFLFIYPEPQKKTDWKRLDIPHSVVEGYRYVFTTLLKLREDPQITYRLSDNANVIYGKWFDNENARYNNADSDQVKGIVAKYQDYCLRFALVLQVLHDGSNRHGIVTTENMERAIRLTEYFLSNMNKAVKLLNPETPLDNLIPLHLKLYKSLPESFTSKVAIEEGQKLAMKDSAIKMFLTRGIEKKIFTQAKRGEYDKNF